ncbi:MAG: deoxyribose-phosphate aldolase [Candidatus Nanopelagicales bacterium]|nr:deoxyribose-phosphate aldolase [Candidatus Nanopelagicales bacterium]
MAAAPSPPSRAELARMVDHTLLAPEATPADVAALCAEATELGVFSVCVSPSFLPLAAGLLGPGIATCTVVGFPSGKHHADIKAAEAARAVADGATEVDMVVDIGAIRAGAWRVTEHEVARVRDATSGVLLKVILETAALSDDEVVRACITCKEAGADFVKTSTGFHPAGGASTHAVSLMAGTVGGTLGIKASGGIRTAQAALAMVAAGATRLGLSGTRAVLDGLAGQPGDGGAEPRDGSAEPIDRGY